MKAPTGAPTERGGRGRDFNHLGLSKRAGVGHDGRVPVLDLSPRISYCSSRGGMLLPRGELNKALEVARWPGVALPAAKVLGSVVIPVVAITGARERVKRGQGPLLDLETLDAWEAMFDGGVPAAPLRIVGFVSTAHRWSAAIEQVRSLGGLGAGMVISRARAHALPLMDADATGVWVVGVPPCEPQPRLWVTGRVGSVPTARRTAATRLMEEALFAHALHHEMIS